MATIGTIGIILVTAAATGMSNAANNYPPIRSTSYFDLAERLFHRHVIAGPVSFLLLFAVPKMLGLFGIAIDLIFVIFGIVWSVKNVKATQRHKEYIKNLAPNYPCRWTRIRLDPTVSRKLGGDAIHYMFYSPRAQAITFPESKYQNRRKYHLLSLKFKPKYGPNYERLTYVGKPFTRKSLFKDPKTADKSFTEVPTVATATLEPVKTSKRIRVRLHDEISERVAKLQNDIYSSTAKSV